MYVLQIEGILPKSVNACMCSVINTNVLSFRIVKTKMCPSFTYWCVDGEVEDKLSFLTKE